MNPILEQLNPQKLQQNPILNAVGQAKQIMRNGGQAMNVVRAMTNGKDAKQVFYQECQRRGVDPEAILSVLK